MKCMCLFWIFMSVVFSSGHAVSRRCVHYPECSPITNVTCDGIDYPITTGYYCLPDYHHLKNLISINSLKLYVENGAFNCLENLLHLNLTNNHLQSFLFPVFSNLSSLKELDLSNNELQFYEHISLFSNLHRLETLILKNNKINSLVNDNIFSDLKELKLLDLQHNLIHRLSYRIFESQRKLITLNLDFNSLKYISVCSFLPLESLRHLGLDGNPFECNCSFKNILLWSEGKGLKNSSNCKSSSFHMTNSINLQNCTVFQCLKNSTEISKQNLNSNIIYYVVIVPLSFLVGLPLYLCHRHRKRISRCCSKPIHREYVKSASIQCHQYEYITPLQCNTISANSIPELPPRQNEFGYETIKNYYEENHTYEDHCSVERSTDEIIMKVTLHQDIPKNKDVGVQTSHSPSGALAVNRESCVLSESRFLYFSEGGKSNLYSGEDGRIIVNSIYSEGNC